MAQYLTTLVRILLVLMSGMSKWNRVHFRRHLGWVLPPNPVHNNYLLHEAGGPEVLGLPLPLLVLVLLVSVLIASGSLAQWEDCWRLYKRGDAEEKCKLENANCKMSGILRLLRNWSLLSEFCTCPLYLASDMDRDLVPFTVNDLGLLWKGIEREGQFFESATAYRLMPIVLLCPCRALCRDMEGI